MAKCLASSSLGTPPDTYLYSLARSGTTFSTIGSDDSLRIFDGSLKLSHHVKSAHTGISCLQAFGAGFATAGRDGVVRCWDVRAQAAGIELRESTGKPLSALACQDHFVAAGTESAKEGLGDVSVHVYDTRNPTTPVRSYVESHTDTITQLAFHPTQPNVLLSGSTDGLVSLFDLNVVEEEDALQQVLNPRSAVHCAGFLSPTEVYVVSTDEQLSIHSLSEDISEEASSVLNVGDVRERLQCMYVVNLIAGQQPVLVCGNTQTESMSIVQLNQSQGWGFGSAIDLHGAHGEEVVRDALLVEDEKKVLTCGEDGQVKLWDLTAAKPRAISTNGG